MCKTSTQKMTTLLKEIGIFSVFSGLHSQHMEVPRAGVESELQLPVHTMATATPDPSCVCDLHRSS